MNPIHCARPPADAGARIFAQRYDLAEVRVALTIPILMHVRRVRRPHQPEIVRSLRRHYRTARIERSPDAGNSIYFGIPDFFNQLVRDFMLDIGYAR